jgi:hypothetical protein
MQMGKKNEGLSLKATTALILIVLFLGVGATLWYYALYQVAYVKIYDIEIIVVEGEKHIGINADPTLYFGKIPSMGGTATKEMNLANDWDIPLLLEIRIKGDAARFITTQDNNFLMQPHEVRKVNFYATIPEGFNKIGTYTGEAKVIYLRP